MFCYRVSWGRGGSKFFMQKRSLKNRQELGAVPFVEEGITRLKSDSSIFPLLIGEYLSVGKSEALWVDSGNTSSTYAMASSGGEEVLDRVTVARAFTCFQHFHICNRLEEFLTSETRYIILPNIDQQYREGVSEKERNDLFQELVSKLKSIKSERPEIKIIYSFQVDDGSQMNLDLFSVTDNVLEVEKTEHGLRENGKVREKFYTESGFLQTTVPYWTRKRREGLEVESYRKNKLNI